MHGAFVSQDQRRNPRGRISRAAATNYRGKPARVANDKSKGASVVRHRSSSERRAAPMQRVMQRERKAGVPGVGQVNQKIARHTQNSAAQWNLNSARAVELNSLRDPAQLSPARPRHFPSSFPLPRRVLFSLFRN